MHVEPRLDKFDPCRAPRGPGRRTKLKPWRTTEGNYDDGNYFKESDEWQVYNARREMIDNQNKRHRSAQSSWTGRTIFIVERAYSKEYGTDQRRQRDTAANYTDELT